MQPALHARPRPPARQNPRSTSRSKYTALPTPTTPRRRRTGSLQLEEEKGDEGAMGGSAGALKTPERTLREVNGARTGASPSPSLLKTSSRKEVEQSNEVETRTDEPTTPPSYTSRAAEHSQAPFPTLDEPSPTNPLDARYNDPISPSSSGLPFSASTTMPASSATSADAQDAYEQPRQLTREELEWMLVEARRIIEEKEQGGGLDIQGNRRSRMSSYRDAPPSSVDGEAPPGRDSPASSHYRTSSIVTPSGSPLATRSRFASNASGLSTFSPATKTLFSPSHAANEVASLSQLNYALTLQLNDLQSDSELADREAGKKLRKLERELQVLREECEHLEARNATLETEAELAKSRENELYRSTRASLTPKRDAVELAEAEATPPFSWRDGESTPIRPVDPIDDEQPADSPLRNFALPTQLVEDADIVPAVSLPDDFPRFPSYLAADPTDAGLLSTPLFPRSVSRSVSTSSLAPLPPPMQLDPSLEQQADELVEQLMSRIEELQDLNEVIVEEREEMMERLEEAERDAVEWRERWEELEEQNMHDRLIGWDGPRAAIAWHSDNDADSDAPLPLPRLRTRRITRRSRLLTQNSDTPPTLSPPSVFSGRDRSNSPTPNSSPQFERPKRALSYELGAPWQESQHSAHQEHGLDGPRSAGPCLSKARRSAPAPVRKRPTSDSPPVTTADDLLPSGSLRWAGHPDADTYDQLEHAASRLLPSWADDEIDLEALSPSRPTTFKRIKGPVAGEDDDEIAPRPWKGKGGKKGKVRVRKFDRYDDGFDDNLQDEVEGRSSAFSRRSVALRRLDREASTRIGLNLVRFAQDSGSASERDSDADSTISSDYDRLDHSLRRRSDYYPLAVRARYHPRMLASMMSDSALRHVVSLITWIRFLVVLSIAVLYSVWQGPKKTLGLVDGRRRLR
ncbi:hypothetical protein Rhopal_000829-T1 [Rhodotorula paludigena]|uniref:Proteophosphoglycan ppg4 n=1 Tax=Rhodotorula paludigena TaxID=86838 RepID=A0AAV5GEV0_9BASI|nr:hypothetical protein Rhopal_000829-T1 [Rhodotorula paludigena]